MKVTGRRSGYTARICAPLRKHKLSRTRRNPTVRLIHKKRSLVAGLNGCYIKTPARYP